MKRITLYFLFCFFSGLSYGQSTLEGIFHIKDDRSYQVSLKEIPTDGDTYTAYDTAVDVETKKTFKLDVPASDPAFYTLSVVMDFPDGRKSNYVTTVFLSPRKKTKIEFLPKDQYSVTANFKKIKDVNNKALLEINEEFTRIMTSLFKEKLDANSVKDSLLLFYAVSDRTIAKNRLHPAVQKYIQFQAFDSYSANMYRFGLDDRGAAGESPATYFNDDMILGFYTGISNIINYLDVSAEGRPFIRRKPLSLIKSHLTHLKEMVSNQRVYDQVAERMLSSYVTSYSTGENYAEDLRVFKQMANDIQNNRLRQDLLQKFANLQFTLKGSPLPKMDFEDIDSTFVNLNKFKGKYLLIDMWASWCAPCIRMMPYLTELEKQYENENIEFIAISIDQNRQSWLNKVKQLDLKGVQLFDANGEFAKKLNISGIPHYLLYSPEGKLILYKTPMPNSDALKEILDSLR